MKNTRSKGGAAATAKKSGPPADIDDYLSRVPEPARTTLQKLRKTILGAAPEATEVLTYGVPAFRHQGLLVSFGATPKHCALYVMSATALGPFEKELRGYDTAKGTVRFPIDAPLSAALVKKLVKARIAENEAATARKAGGAKSGAAKTARKAGAKSGAAKTATRKAGAKGSAGAAKGAAKSGAAKAGVAKTSAPKTGAPTKRGAARTGATKASAAKPAARTKRGAAGPEARASKKSAAKR